MKQIQYVIFTTLFLMHVIDLIVNGSYVCLIKIFVYLGLVLFNQNITSILFHRDFDKRLANPVTISYVLSLIYRQTNKVA